jgi:hypothetical protein
MGREQHTTICSFKQRDAQFSFKLFDLCAQGWLRDELLIGSDAKRTRIGDRNKITQLLKGWPRHN